MWKWTFLALAIAFVSETAKSEQQFVLVYPVQQPQIVWVPVQTQQPQYYRVQPSTQGSRQYWRGASTTQDNTGFGVQQRYQTSAGHNCQHGPNGSYCTNNLTANRQYQLTDNGEVTGGGEYKNAADNARSYTHNGNPYTVNQIQNRENAIADINATVANLHQDLNAASVKIQAARAQALRERNASNYREIDAKLARLDALEQQVRSTRGQVSNISSRLNR